MCGPGGELLANVAATWEHAGARLLLLKYLVLSVAHHILSTLTNSLDRSGLAGLDRTG